MTNDFSIIENKLTNKFSNILVFGILFLSIIIFLCVIEPFNLINIIPILILIIYIRSVFSKV